MPVFDITAPDGTHYEVTGPEGSTEQQALAQVQAQHQATPAQEPTTTQEIAASLPARVGRGMMEPVIGAIQGIAHLTGNLSGDMSFANDFDSRLKSGHQLYQGARQATGQTGVDLGRIAGNVLSPVNYALPEVGATGLLGRVAVGAAQGGALGGLQPVYDSDNYASEKATQVGLGAAGGALLPAIGGISKAGGKLLTHVLGGTTGTGANAVKGAYQAGKAGGVASQAFTDSMRGNTPWTDVVAQAKEALGNMRAERNIAYRSGMQDISKDATVLDFKPVDEALSKATQVKTFKGQDLSPKTATVRGEIQSAIDHWKGLDPAEYHTPEGFDALKQKIGDIKDALPFNTPERVVADNAYNAIRKTIADQAPAYNKVMSDYSKASEEVSNIQRELSLGAKGNPGTALKKLQSVMRNNVNTNWGARASMADRLSDAGAATLLPRLAGQSMNAVLPRGLARAVDAGLIGVGGFTNPMTLASLPLASPRVVGELAHGAGALSRGAAALGNLPVIQALPRIPVGAFGAATPNLFINPAVSGAQ